MEPSSRVAILVNGNAKRVSDAVVAALRDVGGADVFVTRTLDEAHDVARKVVERRYDTVLLGGGDGTFVAWTSDILNFADELGATAPSFALLPLGTGNALATTLGTPDASPLALRQAFRRARNGDADARPIDLLEVDGKLTPFAGFGLDALILEDHHRVEGTLASLGVNVGANAGYALSILLRSIPRYAIADYPEITVTNIGAPAILLDADGQPLGDPVAAGEVLFQGRASIASASTIPFVGLNLRLFPHARRERGRFNLRVADAGPLEILGHLPSLWRGTWRSASIHDFLCTAIAVESTPKSPFQIGGDPAGRRERAVIEIARRRVRILS
ncbi:MAG: diacylglycerol kinase family protein [Myxococcota bacterium]|mgnify:CR=1 FL=1